MPPRYYCRYCPSINDCEQRGRGRQHSEVPLTHGLARGARQQTISRPRRKRAKEKTQSGVEQPCTLPWPCTSPSPRCMQGTCCRRRFKLFLSRSCWAVCLHASAQSAGIYSVRLKTMRRAIDDDDGERRQKNVVARRVFFLFFSPRGHRDDSLTFRFIGLERGGVEM